MASITIDKDNIVTGFCTGGFLNGGVDVPDENLPSDFFENWQSYRLKGKTLTLDKSLLEKNKEAERIAELRRRRDIECFSVVNRGKLWYDSLTKEQTAELKTWYQDWLNVTDTKQIPKKLKWM